MTPIINFWVKKLHFCTAIVYFIINNTFIDIRGQRLYFLHFYNFLGIKNTFWGIKTYQKGEKTDINHNSRVQKLLFLWLLTTFL